MLYEVLGDIWVVRRNPYLEDDLLANPRRLRLLVEALRHRLHEIEQRRQGDNPDAARDRRVQELLARARAAVDAFEPSSPRPRELRRQRAAPRCAPSRAATTSSSTAWRASRT